MAGEEVVTPDSNGDKSSRSYVLTWINKLLKTNFKDVRDVGSGACYCQIMDCTFPGSIDLTKVKFDAQSEDDCKHNFSLLQDAFHKKGIGKTIPVDELIKRDFKSSFDFLKWFKVFYTSNVQSKDYDPVKARNNHNISPVVVSSPSRNSRLESDMEKDGNVAPTRSLPYSKMWKDYFSWAEPSSLGERYTYCSSCGTSLYTFQRGLPELQRHGVTNKHKKRASVSKNGELQSKVTDSLPCSDAALRFIQIHCCGGSAKGEQELRAFAQCKLGLGYPKDIISVCRHTPYCVYIYGGVAVGGGETVSVILLGYFDMEASSHCIRFLDAVKSGGGRGDQTPAAVVKTLKKFDLPTDNLAVYFSSDDGEASEQIGSYLRELNPNVIALGGLYNMADAACHAAIKELASQAQEVMVDLHAHYSSHSTKNDNLKALFGSDFSNDSKPFYLNIGCLSFCQLVTKMLEIWTDLISYFSSCQEDKEKARYICSQLKDPKLKATFMFLEQALKPLQNFHRQIQRASWANMPSILEEASTLLSTYTSHFLQPNAASLYLKEHDAQILKNKKFHLSSPDLNLGGKAVEEFLKTSKAVEELPQLREEVLSFYVALTSCIAEELPLSDMVLKIAAQLLNPQNTRKVKRTAVKELGTKLGFCASPDEIEELTREFREYQLTEEGSEEKTAPVPLEKHWTRVLKDIKSTSVFRKLVLTLLSFPCPSPDAHQVFTQALENGDSLISSEGKLFTESGLDESLDSSLADSSNNKDTQTDTREMKFREVMLKPCEVRLTRINYQFEDLSALKRSLWKEGTCRGGFGRESSLRQKPLARTVFQAGVSTWCKPVDLDTDLKNGLKSRDEVLFSESTPPRGGQKQNQNGKKFLTGELVWGKLNGLSWWPGMVMAWKTKSSPMDMRKVEWFGENMLSEIHTEKLMPFSAFTTCFCKNSFSSLPTYKEAIYHIIEFAAERCGKSFSQANGNKEEELKLMVDWASTGFLPTGPAGFAPRDSTPPPESPESPDSPDSSVSEYQPPRKRKYVFKNKAVTPSIYNRESLKNKIREKDKTIEDFCLSCASPDIYVQHPLFEGGLCPKCTDNFAETLYRYDEDGYQSYCTVCCAGSEVILCGNSSCCRCFCKDCLDILVADGTFDKLKEVDPWDCYICNPSQCKGNLKLRPDWSVRVQDFFANNSTMEFEPHRVYPSIPANQRRPIKVLSLFDGIATGYLVLSDLGFKIERYIASEICDNSIAVGMIKHGGKIEYVNDARTITRKHLAEWGPFDLLIGGSPCNDLSTVNPNRKGLFEGTGRLFFEYYRILNFLKPKEDDNRPFFWLFENVVCMNNRDKSDICRFLECNPVLIDAVKVSPAHRARYFWGNVPGMHRPLATSVENKLTLQECLEVGREAKFEKVRTITTKVNSLRQGKMGPLPVSMNGKDDNLWCTELEQIFGFPKHYTDVNNMGRMHRLKALGRSWSVPVIRHLLAPLKDYFECESGQ